MRRRLAALIGAVRQADWFTERRARAYCWMVAALVLIQTVNLLARLGVSAIADPHWRPETTDFNAFWSASVLAVHGHPAAYDPAAMEAAHAIGAQPAAGQFLPYMNPPVFLLLCLPLGALPYLPAMAAFVCAGYYAAVRILHGGMHVAFAGQALAAGIAAAALIRHASRRPGGMPEVAATVAASLLCTPYVLDYDLVCLAVPMAWIARRGSLSGWLPWEKLLLATLYIYPLAARNLNLRAGIPLAPVLLAELFCLILARSRGKTGRPARPLARATPPRALQAEAFS